MDKVLSVGTVSSSHTYGNLIETIRDDIISKFSENYFNHVQVSTELVFRQVARYSKTNDIEFRKQEKPSIAIKPVVEVTGDDTPFKYTLLGSTIQGNSYGLSRMSLLNFIKDTSNRYSLHYKLNRDKLSFDVTIHLSTLVEQIDLFKSIENIIWFNGPKLKNVCLEAVIPNQIVSYIGKMVNIDMDTNRAAVPMLVTYLNKHSNYPITYKIRNSTSLPEFFMYYDVPALISYEGLSISEGNRKGMIDDDFAITFNVNVEFNLPGSFILVGDDSKEIVQLNGFIQPEKSATIVPLFTMDRIYENSEYVSEGFKIYTSTLFKTEKELDNKEDVIDLHDVIEDVYIPIINKYENTPNLLDNILLKFIIYKNRDILEKDKDFIVDYKNLKLILKNCDSSVTYRLIVYMQMDIAQKELTKYYDEQNTDKRIGGI